MGEVKQPVALSDVLAKYESLVIDAYDPEAAAEADRVIAEGQAYEGRIRRAEALDRDHVPLDPKTREAIVAGGSDLCDVAALRAVRAWLKRDDVPPFLVLSGPTGTGKSVAAAYALSEWRGGIWRTAAQLCRTFSASFGDQVDDQELCLTARMLVCDDVGTEDERHRARMGTTLVELLEHRKRGARTMRTVITTNLNRRDFAAHYGGARLASRMDKAAGLVAFVEAGGKDMRKAVP